MKKLKVKTGHQFWYRGTHKSGALLDYDAKLANNPALVTVELPDPPIEISFGGMPEIVITPVAATIQEKEACQVAAVEEMTVVPVPAKIKKRGRPPNKLVPPR